MSSWWGGDGVSERLASVIAQYEKAFTPPHAPIRPSGLGLGTGSNLAASGPQAAFSAFALSPANSQLIGAGMFGALPGLAPYMAAPYMCAPLDRFSPSGSAQQQELQASQAAVQHFAQGIRHPGDAAAQHEMLALAVHAQQQQQLYQHMQQLQPQVPQTTQTPQAPHAPQLPLTPQLPQPVQPVPGVQPANQFTAAPRWDEPVKCQVCPRVFSTKYQAKKHFLRRHFVGEKRFVCSRCQKKSFSVREDLTMHYKACGRIFICSCGLQLRSQATLKRHCKHTSHEPTSWEGVPIAPTAAELQGLAQPREDDGASSSDMDSLAGTPGHTPITTPEVSPYTSPAAIRRFPLPASSQQKQPVLLARAAAKAHNGGPAGAQSAGAVAKQEADKASKADGQGLDGGDVEEMTADELLDMLSNCL